MKNLGYCLVISLLPFLFVACDGGSSSDNGNPLRSGNSDDFYCKVTRNGGNLLQEANIPGECEAFAEIVDNGDGTSLMSTEMTVYGKSAEEYESICDSLSEISNVFVPGSYQCKNGYFRYKILVDNNKINLDEVEKDAKKECENNEAEYKENSQPGNVPVESSESNSNFSSSSFGSPEESSFKNSVTCDVSKEGNNVVQRMTLNEFGSVEKMTATYAPGMEEWNLSIELLFDGFAAESMAADACEEFKSESENVSCTGNKVSYSMDYGGVGDADELVTFLQKECEAMKSDYNGVDFDGPRETPSDLPTSCKVTEGESSLTVNVSYRDWAYSSTIQISGSVSHEEELFTGDYGDMAEKMCLSDKSDPDNGSVVCDGGKITIDGTWDESLTLAEMKLLSDYMCDALLDGTVTFEEMMFEE